MSWVDTLVAEFEENYLQRGDDPCLGYEATQALDLILTKKGYAPATHFKGLFRKDGEDETRLFSRHLRSEHEPRYWYISFRKPEQADLFLERYDRMLNHSFDDSSKLKWTGFFGGSTFLAGVFTLFAFSNPIAYLILGFGGPMTGLAVGHYQDKKRFKNLKQEYEEDLKKYDAFFRSGREAIQLAILD